MNIARITLYLIAMRGNEPVARMQGAKHRDYFFFKDPDSTRYRRVYEEGSEPNPERGRFPLELDLVNAHIEDISTSGDIKDIGLRVVFETQEQVEAERERIFAKFTRGARQQDGSVPGLGLGLHLAQHALQVGPQQRDMRPLVPGRLAERLAIDQLAVAGEKGVVGGLAGGRDQGMFEAVRAQLLHRMGADIDADVNVRDVNGKNFKCRACVQ